MSRSGRQAFEEKLGLWAFWLYNGGLVLWILLNFFPIGWPQLDVVYEHGLAYARRWPWASNNAQSEPDVVMACAGDVPTLETLAAVSILREQLPGLKVRVINVVDLMKLQPNTEHPHGLSDRDFDELFTASKPVIFAFHTYPWLIYRLTYGRTNHNNFDVRGY